MDEPKATRQEPKWWSRPRWAPGKRPEPDTEPPPAPVAGTDTEPPSARGAVTSDDSEPGDSGASRAPGASAQAAHGDSAALSQGTQGAHGTSSAPVTEETAAPVPVPVPAARPEPLHGVDPYSTPPYGGPGPWAPAPPVQRPSVTPPRGVVVPPGPAAPSYEGQAVTPPQGVAVPPGAAAPSYEGPTVTPPRGVVVPPGVTTPPYGVPTDGPGSEPGPAQEWAAGRTSVVSGDPQPLMPPAAVEPQSPLSLGSAPGRPRRRSRIAIGALVLALAAGGAGGVIGAYVERNGNVSDVKLPQTAAGPAGEGGERPKGSIAGIARQTLPGVVTLHARGGGAEATGTGFVLDRRGHILTNNHVVESAKGTDGVRVTFNGGQTATGEIVGTDSGYDLAVVKVSGVSGLTPLPLGNSDAVRVGDPVIAFGAPFDLDGTVTTGIVSATQRPITAGGEEPGSESSYVDALQTDAPINPGNSGGPLVDSRGRVIGVNSAIKGAGSDSGLPEGEGGGSGSVGLGFAIPVNQARRVAEELINEGRATHPVIGVTLDTEYEGAGARIGGAGGGQGDAVVRGGPADKAGLKAGDVVTKVGDKLVTSGEELIVRIRSHRPGEKLELTVRRGGPDGAQRTVRVTLGSATG
ncbi:trypsin-like peptidase domain-containing protein [Streptomyces sp. CA-250714]|uniref:S1C family serine protease n=1 Tax=Streptomyces sp. CA-250714 TaxID=3240060 RepID=UPI003D94D18B